MGRYAPGRTVKRLVRRVSITKEISPHKRCVTALRSPARSLRRCPPQPRQTAMTLFRRNRAFVPCDANYVGRTIRVSTSWRWAVRTCRWDTASRPVEAAIYLTVAVVLVVTGTVLRTVVLNWIVGPVSVVVGVMVLSKGLERRRGSHR